ncbi:MAG: PorP/SprF family type IX secretion system membrane protein [Chitinophagaceae bacterium]
MKFEKIIAVALLCLSLGATGLVNAQDLHFSQFYETDILRNPALMGTFKGDYKIGAVYRSQWSSISKPFQTGLVTAESRLPVKGESGDYFTIGLLAYFDKAGSIDLQTMAIYPAINFTKYLGDGSHTFITAGFTGGYSQRSFDPSKMTTNSQYIGGQYNPDNPTMEGFSDSHISSWDLGAGIGINSGSEDEKTTYYAGISSYHFTRPKQSFNENNQLVKLDIKWNVAAGFSYRLSDQYGIQAHANYQRQGVYNEFIGGGLLGWKRITNNESDAALSLYGGVFYRVSDAAIPTIKVDYKTISITASYDFTTSKLRPANDGNGGFEISVMQSGLFNSDKFVRARTICPKPW